MLIVGRRRWLKKRRFLPAQLNSGDGSVHELALERLFLTGCQGGQDSTGKRRGSVPGGEAGESGSTIGVTKYVTGHFPRHCGVSQRLNREKLRRDET